MLSDLAYDTSVISALIFYRLSQKDVLLFSLSTVCSSVTDVLDRLGNAGDLLNRHTYTNMLLHRQSALLHPLYCHLLYRREKVLLIRTGLSLSAIHHHLTSWSSLLITPFLSHTHTRTRTRSISTRTHRDTHEIWIVHIDWIRIN